MDNVFWVVIAAAVAIAMAGIVLYIGSDGLNNVVEDGNETGNAAVCDFQVTECEAGRISYSRVDSSCQDQISGSSCPPS